MPEYRHPALFLVFKNNRGGMAAAFALMMLGGALYFYGEGQFSELVTLLSSPRALGIILALVGVAWMYSYPVRHILLKGSRSFSDIDRAPEKSAPEEESSRRLIAELRSLQTNSAVDYGKIEEIIKKSQRSQAAASKAPKTFEEYFTGISLGLTTRAAVSDEKSSVLLDKGIFYVRFGMIFYFVAILAWQILVHYSGYKPEYVYGMATTSLLFLFIEFLSAWFLKQYRHFVDTGTYLLKVKGIFDRYYLIYLALRGNEQNIAADPKKIKTLADALTEDIKWPNDNHLTRADAAFAREALDSVSELFKALRTQRKKKAEKEAEAEE